MKNLTFNRPNLLSKLHDELLAAVPSIRPVNGTPVMAVSGDDTHVYLTIPDNADNVAVTAVVNAHDPTPPPVPRAIDYGGDQSTRDQAVDAVVQLRQYLGVASPTLAQSTSALKVLIRMVLFLATKVVT